tara:strand:+ start:2889 stop:3662 length:774 start_codon:yes stop_codon:yes gene_type:complete
MYKNLLIILSLLTICLSRDCDPGYDEINGLCFHAGDIGIIQKMIDNSYQSSIDLGCEDWDNYCGSPNPYMDDVDSWFWVSVDSVYYEWPGNGNGVVEPLELGIQEWENGRLTSIMCGAYIYCQLSGPIPEEINTLADIRVLRLEYNYFSGFIPNTVCDLNIDNDDYLEFDLSGNLLCPPYPDCISTDDFWYQDTSSCSEIGDVNFDSIINISDVIILISTILEGNELDYQEFMISDVNSDGNVDILDIVEIVYIILN